MSARRAAEPEPFTPAETRAARRLERALKIAGRPFMRTYLIEWAARAALFDDGELQKVAHFGPPICHVARALLPLDEPARYRVLLQVAQLFRERDLDPLIKELRRKVRT